MMDLPAPNLLSILLGFSFLSYISCDQVTLLTTEGATTDLRWEVENINETPSSSGWEDTSIPYKDSIVRGYQVCDFNVDQSLKEKPQSWLILPGVNMDGASRIFIEMNFTMRECSDLEKTCRETFSVYYRLTDANVLNYKEEFSPSSFTKIDTVAAEVRFLASSPPNTWNSLINRETVSISFPNTTKRKLLNIAIVDAGACVALMGVRIYHKVCKETKAGFSVFEETKTGVSDTSLVQVTGTCVANSVYLSPGGSQSGISSIPDTAEPTISNQGPIGPLYHCTSSGDWQVQTGSCQCKPGYQPDGTKTNCIPCKTGTYKDLPGNHNCVECPAHSSTSSIAATTCLCDLGYSTIMRHSQEDYGEIGSDCELCSKTPEPPLELKIGEVDDKDPGFIQITWKRPVDSGGCSNIQYCVFCQFSPLNESNVTGASACDHLHFEPSRCHVNMPKVTAKELRGHTAYNFTVIAFTVATKQRYPKIFEILSSSARNRKANSTRDKSLPAKGMDRLLEASSTFVSYTTGDTLPSGIRNAAVAMENQTTIFVQWMEPEFPNGEILFYKIRYVLVYEVTDDSDEMSEAPARYVSNALEWEEKNTNETRAYLTDLFPGSQYEIIITAHNSAGSDNGSIPLYALTVSFDETTSEKPPTPDHFPYLVATVVIATLVVIICLLLVVQWKCRARNKKEAGDAIEQPTEFRPYNSHHETLDQRTYVDPFSLDAMPPHRFLCETSPESITCEEVIGCGEFGEVYKGTLATIDLKTGQETTIDVAVKQLRDQCEPQEQIDFLREAMSLEKFRHPNIVHLEAVVTKNRPFFILTELMDHGSLHNFLTKCKEKALTQSNGGWTPPVTHMNLARMLHGVASGMEYLCGRGYVHRDLAARNVLVNSDLTCKVADFGLMRELESNVSENGSNGTGTYTTRGGKIAIRWTAPEAIAFRTFTQFSDVWSFGILMWEATSFGEKPYWDLTNHEVIKAVTDGMRLPAPEKCPSVLHQIMLECWQRDHHKRPTFTNIIAKFNHMISEPDILNVPASPASCGVQEEFFGDVEETPRVEDSQPLSTVPVIPDEEISDDESSPSDVLLGDVTIVDGEEAKSQSDSSDEDLIPLDRDEEGSEVSSCTSTICASEITVCAGNGVAVYVPLLRSDSDEIRPITPTRNYYSLTR